MGRGDVAVCFFAHERLKLGPPVGPSEVRLHFVNTVVGRQVWLAMPRPDTIPTRYLGTYTWAVEDGRLPRFHSQNDKHHWTTLQLQSRGGL